MSGTNIPQGLKPRSFVGVLGTTKVEPFRDWISATFLGVAEVVPFHEFDLRSACYNVRLNSGVAISSVAMPKTMRNSRSYQMATHPPSLSSTALKPWIT